MISAKQAKEQSEVNRIKTMKYDIESSIKKAIQKGKTQIFLMGELLKEVRDELEQSGFVVEAQATGMKITW